MKDLNEAFVHLNVGLPDDVERLKAAGYYKEAVARIDEYLAEDWTETQNSPRSQGLEMPEYEQPANPVPHGVDALRDADRKSTRLNSSHDRQSRMPSSA